MKKIIHIFIMALGLAVLCAGCCRKQFLQHYDRIEMRSATVILEARGDTVPFEIRVLIPKGLLCGGIGLEVTPCLRNDSIKTVYPAQRLALKAGDSVDLVVKPGAITVIRGYFMNFKPLQDAYFMVEWRAVQGKKAAPLNDRLLGYGISQVYHYAQSEWKLAFGMDARATLDSLRALPGESADRHYLMAVMCARLLDGDGARDHLIEAVRLEPGLSLRLAGDVEFVYFRNTDWFAALSRR